MCLGYSSACGVQLIRFSNTQMCHPHSEAVVYVLHTKAEAHTKIPFDTMARSKQHVRVVQW